MHDGACGVVDGEQQGEARATLLEPGVVAAVELEQHPRARHALAPHAVLWRAAPPRAGHAGPRQDAPHRGAAEGEALVLLEQLGEVGVVGARVARGGEARHGSRDGLGDGVVGAPAAVAVGERLGAELPVGGQEPAGVRSLRSISAAACPIVISSARTLLSTWSRACSCWCNVSSFIEGQNR